MGDELEPTRRVIGDAPAHDRGAAAAAAPAADASPPDPAPDITIPAADPFASTLTVAVGPAPAGPKLEPGRDLGPVRLVREIGRGATGTVFQGHHTVLGRDVAVKFLINVTAGPGDAEGLRRFVDEARAAASVRHPNLTQVFHADLDGTTPYLVLEYVQGPTLRQLLDHAGELTVPVAAAILSDVASAVAELHARGIIHRDIKPSNVLVDKDGRVFVTDFGLALRRSHAPGHGAASAEIEFAGTPAYMAGEMFEGRVSSRSDVYAMGVMAFQLLTGSTPYSGTFHELREKHLREPLPVEALACRGVKPEAVEVIERSTNKQAMFRYKTAPDFARALCQAAGCGVPELARARKKLCDLVIARASGTPAAVRSGGGTLTAEVRAPHRAGGDDDDSGSSLYTETISRIATLKRERRRHPFSDDEGSSGRLPVVPALPASEPAALPTGQYDAPPAQPTTTSVALPGAQGDPGRPHPASIGAASAAGEGSPASGTGSVAVLGMGVLSILYGALAAVWQVGMLFGATERESWLPRPSRSTVPIYVFLVTAAIVHVLIVGMFVPSGVALLWLKRWARRMLAFVSVADVVLQALVLLVALAWIEPVTVSESFSGNRVQPADRTAREAVVTKHWLAQWFTLSLFPAVALVMITRRRFRDDYEAAAQAANTSSDAEADKSEPFF